MPTRRTVIETEALAATLSMAGTRATRAATPRDVAVMAKQIDDIITLDPAESFEYTGGEICGNVYQKLTTTPNDNPSRLEGDLAESWTAGDDARTFTFRPFASPARTHSVSPSMSYVSVPVSASDPAVSPERNWSGRTPMPIRFERWIRS